MKTKFLVFTDLHTDIVHDTVARVQVMCEAAKREGAEHFVHLGDIMYPETEFLLAHAPESIEKRRDSWFLCDRDDEKVQIKKLLKETGLPVHGTLGNHDMDSCSKATACLYWNMPDAYYSYVEGGVRFIALDTNRFITNAGYIDYDHNNYKYSDGPHTTWLGEEQIAWLEGEIMASAEPCVLLSHAPLAGDMYMIHDSEQLLAMLRRVNRDRRRVILSLNGHTHVDGMCVAAGVPMVTINSASNHWMGEEYATVRYSETICRMYPHLPNCAPYQAALYSVITISDEGIEMTGVDSIFVGKTPKELNFSQDRYSYEPTAAVSARKLPLTEMTDTPREV